MKTTKIKRIIKGTLSLLLLFFVAVAGAEEPNGIERMKQKFDSKRSVADLTPTVAALAGIPVPESSIAEPIPEVLDLAKERFSGTADKILIFCSDAIGNIQFLDHPDDFAPLTAETDLRVLGTNVLPSVTPVCFATIFTGAPPEIHGIQKYERPVLTVKTLFDAYLDAGKKVALIAENDCSLDLIFRQRKIDYYSFPSNREAFEFTVFLLNHRSDFPVDYDLILSYDGGYDSTMHANGVADPKSLDAMRLSIHRYLELAELTDRVWSDLNRGVIFASDHGSHDDANGKGKHGTDSAEDVLVNHFYRLRGATSGTGK